MLKHLWFMDMKHGSCEKDKVMLSTGKKHCEEDLWASNEPKGFGESELTRIEPLPW
jgi:hypothetical protein